MDVMIGDIYSMYSNSEAITLLTVPGSRNLFQVFPQDLWGSHNVGLPSPLRL